jgi:orotate phosphoribosyltransferase|tara:strand:+ start:24790 stop:25431 length:642 start_codon:yes stop_codon:yes gene_type:complete
MIFDKNLALQTAKHLLQINAIKLNLENPFTWASGWKSPIYCDNRIILSYPKIRSLFSDIISKKIAQEHNDQIIIAGVATGAIGIAMLVADKLNLPFIYIRPEAKKHGQKNQIEGHLNSKLPVLVIEDLISTGKSSLNAVNSIKNVGANVVGMIALFTYGFEMAERAFTNANVNVQTLCDYEHLLSVAESEGEISAFQKEKLKIWRKDPSAWNN